MYGMATIGNQNLSDYNSRTVVIEVITAGSHKKVRNSHFTLKVPYSSLSQTIRRITSKEGKIVSVSILPSFSNDLTVSSVPMKSENELVISEDAAIKQKITKQETAKQETIKQEKLVTEKPVEPKETVKEVKPEETVATPKSKSKNIAIPFKDLIPKKDKKPRSRKKVLSVIGVLSLSQFLA